MILAPLMRTAAPDTPATPWAATVLSKPDSFQRLVSLTLQPPVSSCAVPNTYNPRQDCLLELGKDEC